MRPVALKRRGEAYLRAKAEKALGRADGWGVCARCGHYSYVNGHERIGRSQGGDATKPDCLLCIPCNNWCEDNPARAVWTGWKISKKYFGRMYQLCDHQAFCVDGSIHTFGDTK